MPPPRSSWLLLPRVPHDQGLHTSTSTKICSSCAHLLRSIESIPSSHSAVDASIDFTHSIQCSMVQTIILESGWEYNRHSWLWQCAHHGCIMGRCTWRCLFLEVYPFRVEKARWCAICSVVTWAVSTYTHTSKRMHSSINTGHSSYCGIWQRALSGNPHALHRSRCTSRGSLRRGSAKVTYHFELRWILHAHGEDLEGVCAVLT